MGVYELKQIPSCDDLVGYINKFKRCKMQEQETVDLQKLPRDFFHYLARFVTYKEMLVLSQASATLNRTISVHSIWQNIAFFTFPDRVFKQGVFDKDVKVRFRNTLISEKLLANPVKQKMVDFSLDYKNRYCFLCCCMSHRSRVLVAVNVVITFAMTLLGGYLGNEIGEPKAILGLTAVGLVGGLLFSIGLYLGVVKWMNRIASRKYGDLETVLIDGEDASASKENTPLLKI